MELSEFNSLVPGDGVELSPATDAWMQGDRYARVTLAPWTPFPDLTTQVVQVRLDKSGRLVLLDYELIQRITYKVSTDQWLPTVAVTLDEV